MSEERVRLTINDRPVEVRRGATLLEAARDVGVKVPTLCSLEGLSPTGACRICVVEAGGDGRLVPACAFPAEEGLSVKTNTPAVRQARKTIIELLLANHKQDCLYCPKNLVCELQALAAEYGVREKRFSGKIRSYHMDLSSPSVERDPEKCILCGRCVRVCEEIQNVGAIDFTGRGFETMVLPAFNRDLNVAPCVFCGQCVLECPTGALREKDHLKPVFDALNDPRKYVVVQVAPAIRVSLGEEFGLPAGTAVTGKIPAALHRLGFRRVFDTNLAADLTILEEATELVDRVRTGKPLPMLTSCSPGWVKYVEHFHPSLLPHVSTCKSPQMMMGAMIKTYFAQKEGIAPEDLYVVSVMPCTAKKYEARRPEMGVHAHPDVDAVLTTREFARMIRIAGIDFHRLEDEPFDDPLGIASGAGDIFGASGGVMEAALRTAHYLLTGEEAASTDVTAVRGLDGVKTAELTVGGLNLKVAAVSGLKNAAAMLDRLKSGEATDYHFIEVMCCPGGCIDGGGQPLPRSREVLEARMKAVYEIDRGKTLRRSHENPGVKALYDEYLGEPNSHRAHELLHTRYTERDQY